MRKDIEFPDCWEELQPDEWTYLLKLRHELMTRQGVSLLDVKRACPATPATRPVQRAIRENILFIRRSLS